MNTRRHHWQLGLAMLLALPIVIALLWPTRHGHNRMHGNRGKCYSNLRQLGQALQMYANEYGGAMPPDWAALVLTQDLPNELIVCPASGDERADATQATELRNQLAAGGHCSYTYLGSGLLRERTPDDVIAFDVALNHDGSINVLFGDGHVESLIDPLMTQLRSRPIGATRPVRLPTPRAQRGWD